MYFRQGIPRKHGPQFNPAQDATGPESFPVASRAVLPADASRLPMLAFPAGHSTQTWSISLMLALNSVASNVVLPAHDQVTGARLASSHSAQAWHTFHPSPGCLCAGESQWPRMWCCLWAHHGCWCLSFWQGILTDMVYNLFAGATLSDLIVALPPDALGPWCLFSR